MKCLRYWHNSTKIHYLNLKDGYRTANYQYKSGSNINYQAVFEQKPWYQEEIIDIKKRNREQYPWNKTLNVRIASKKITEREGQKQKPDKNMEQKEPKIK